MERFRARVLVVVGSLLAVLAALGALSGCGGSSSKIGAGPLVVGTFVPYTGSNASFGVEGSAICDAGTKAINDGGGVLGHTFTCKPFDSTEDPADALPVANRMIASTSNLALMYGPAAVEPAVEAELNNAKLVHLSVAGDPRYENQTSPYFYRLSPSDAVTGTALAAYAMAHGYTHAAAVFTNDQSAQTSVPSTRSTYPKLGGKFAADITLAPGQTSYRTEVSQVLASHADAVIGEIDPQTAATFLSEMSQLNNGKLLPILTTSRAIESDWIGAVLKVIGATAFEKYIVAVSFNVPTAGPGYSAFVHDLNTAPQTIAERSQYLTDPFAQWNYDGIVMCALAMLQTKSTDSATWAPEVARIANGSPGTVLVHTFPEGKAALLAGKPIHYIGASGQLVFTASHNNAAPYAGYVYSGTGSGPASLLPTGGTITPQQLARDEH
jgi:ABC-type branched-subunit amino acid transport system substrate-binding protein